MSCYIFSESYDQELAIPSQKNQFNWSSTHSTGPQTLVMLLTVVNNRLSFFGRFGFGCTYHCCYGCHKIFQFNTALGRCPFTQGEYGHRKHDFNGPALVIDGPVKKEIIGQTRSVEKGGTVRMRMYASKIFQILIFN